MPLPPIPAFIELNATACGVAQTPITPVDLVQLFNDASSDDLKAIANRAGVFSLWNTEAWADLNDNIFDILPIEEVIRIIQKWLPRALSEIVFSGEIKIATSGPCTIVLEYIPPNEIHVILTITPDCLGGATGGHMRTFKATLVDSVCADTSNAPENLEVAEVVDDTSNTGQAQFFQRILNKLNQLLRCCNPCPPSALISIGEIEDAGTYFAEGSEAGMVIDQIEFRVAEVRNPVDTFLNKPLVRKFGKFAWIAAVDGGTDKLDWINWDFETRFAPPDHKVVGFAWNLDFGVKLSFTVSTKPGWNLP